MSNDLLYWIYMGLAFAVPIILSLAIMRTTKRMALSFWIGTAVSLIITAAASFWWAAVTEGRFQIQFGVAVYLIAFINTICIDLFVLISIKKKGI